MFVSNMFGDVSSIGPICFYNLMSKLIKKEIIWFCESVSAVSAPYLSMLWAFHQTIRCAKDGVAAMSFSKTT